MLRTLLARIKQGHRTVRFPSDKISLPQRFRGLPMVQHTQCPGDCRRCMDVCPTGAISHFGKDISMDLGKCIFCGDCSRACPNGAIGFTKDYRLSARKRGDLIFRHHAMKPLEELDRKMKKIFGRSLKLRQVSAGGCNACEQDVNVLNTLVFDLGRFGIQFVASPRHADGLLVTGPVTENMRLALKKTYDAVPWPKIVIAAGACAISGGIFANHPEVHNGAESVIPVDLFIPGCPPHPWTILDGLVRLLGKIQENSV